MITKHDIIRILADNYKSKFDETSIEMLHLLTPIIVCACQSNAEIKDGDFLRTTLESIGIAWTIYALQLNDSDNKDKVRSFLEFADFQKVEGFQHFTEAVNIIRTHLTDL